MNRRTWWKCVASLSLSVLCSLKSARGENEPSLKNTLEKGLYCRKPNEFEFVDLVAQKVAEKKLPLDLVLALFQWARERRPNFPFPYFQAAVIKRAAEMGVQL